MVIDPAKPFDLNFTVDEAFDGLRLDRYLNTVVPTISRTRIQKYNDDGRILVNDTPRPHNWKVRLGDLVLLKCRIPAGTDVEEGRRIPVSIVYEDEYLIAVNKQPGLVVHPVALHRHNTLMNALYYRYKDILPEGKELSLVNRIDKLTSGLVLVSKDMRAKRHLQQQFEDRTVYKTYLAIACGHVAEDQGEINLPIGPKENTSNRCIMDVRRDNAGKDSLTHYWALERFVAGDEKFTLLRLSLKTGRQHQIRVHAKAIGHPLVGDHLYNDNRGRRWQNPDGTTGELARFALHSETLTIEHPIDGTELRLEAPLPDDMTNMLAALRNGLPLEPFLLFEEHEETVADNCADDAATTGHAIPPGEHEFDTL